MDEAHLCDELLLLHQGQVVRQGKPEALLAEYPHRLYRISSSSSALAVPKGVSLPQGVALLYPEGGSIHAALSDKNVREYEILSLVRPLLPKAESAVRVSPKIEDLFIHLLSQIGNAR
jgi:ABC-type uncharacterized transport system ATPase subunit